MSGEHLRELALHRLRQIKSLQAEIKELKEAREAKRERHLKNIASHEIEIESLQAENAKLREALEKYVNIANPRWIGLTAKQALKPVEKGE